MIGIDTGIHAIRLTLWTTRPSDCWRTIQSMDETAVYWACTLDITWSVICGIQKRSRRDVRAEDDK